MGEDNISIEPLLNQSSEGDGSSRRVGFVPIDTAGATDHRTEVSLSSTPTVITPTVGKRTIEVQNIGGSDCYYGGVGVTSSNGIKLFSSGGRIWANIKDSFSVSFVTNGSDTTELRVVEYD